MDILLAVTVLLVWNFLGAFCYVLSAPSQVSGWELVNLVYTHKYFKSVNWIGAFVLSLLYSIMCPVGTLFYWIYKICTFGNRRD